MDENSNDDGEDIFYDAEEHCKDEIGFDVTVDVDGNKSLRNIGNDGSVDLDKIQPQKRAARSSSLSEPDSHVQMPVLMITHPEGELHEEGEIQMEAAAFQNLSVITEDENGINHSSRGSIETLLTSNFSAIEQHGRSPVPPLCSRMENLIRQSSNPNFTAGCSPSSPTGSIKLTASITDTKRDSNETDDVPKPPPFLTEFMIRNTDTGETHDLRSYEPPTNYSLIPSRHEILQRQNSDSSLSTITAENDTSDDKPTTFGPPPPPPPIATAKKSRLSSPATILTKTKKKTLSKMNLRSQTAKTVLRGLGKTISKKVPKLPLSSVSTSAQIRQETVPCNSLLMKGGGKEEEVLLLSVFKAVHKGPIWCMGFSPDGCYFATGGEDGMVLIWNVGMGGAKQSQHENPHFHTDNVETTAHNDKIQRGCGSSTDTTGSNTSNITGDTYQDQEQQIKDDLPFIGTGPPLGQEIQLLPCNPLQTYKNHKSSIISLSFSPTSFLLTASLDRTVSLFHPTSPTALHIFHHSDMVTAVAFHPIDSHLFITGGFDKKLRLWNIHEARVVQHARCPHVITAARFTPSGRFVVAGTIEGQVYFFDKQMKYYTQLDTFKKGKEGKKVTGFDFLMGFRHDNVSSDDNITKLKTLSPEQYHNHNDELLSWCTSWETCDTIDNINAATATDKLILGKGGAGIGEEDGLDFGHSSQMGPESLSFPSSKKANKKMVTVLSEQMLVTTNDSRIRLYDLDDFHFIKKYKGILNRSMQIKARFSESCHYIICGSENGCPTIWPTENPKTRGKVESSNKNNKFALPNSDGKVVKADVQGGISPPSSGNKHKPTIKGAKTGKTFEATKASLPIVTDVCFAPFTSAKSAFINSGLFPSSINFDHLTQNQTNNFDLSTAVIVTSDYDGTIRVFLLRSCLDEVIKATGPEGSVFEED